MKINVVLVEFEYIENGVVGYDYYSNTGFTTSSTDNVVPNRYYKSGVLDDPYIVNGFKEPLTIGGLKLRNDGDLDVYMQTRITDGRKIKIYVGRDNMSLDKFMQVFTGTIKKFRFSENIIEIVLSDNKELLNKEIQSELYPDTADYPEGIRNTPKPLCYGSVWNITPITLDTTRENHQFHSETMTGTSVTAYDGGVIVPITSTNGTHTDGKVTVTTTPYKSITLSVSQPNDSTNPKTILDIFRAIIVRVYPKAVFNENSMTAFASGTVTAGVFLTQKTNAVQFLDEWLATVRACWFFNAAGAVEIAQLDVPKTTADFSIEPYQILSFSISSNDDYELAHTVKLSYQKNWTVQNEGDLGSNLTLVSTDRKMELAKDYFRFAQRENVGMKETYPNAVLKEIKDSYLMVSSSAGIETLEWATICSVPRFTMTVKCTGYNGLTTRQMKLGDTVQVTSSRYGIKKGVVTKLTQHFASTNHELELFF